jgi:hypothetical protein
MHRIGTVARKTILFLMAAAPSLLWALDALAQRKP